MGGSGKSGTSGKGGKGGKGGKAALAANLDWSVMIVPDPNNPGFAGFQPDVLPRKIGNSLQAQVSDIVTWGNLTADKHQPVRLDNGQPLCDPIAGNASSTPQYVVVGKVGDLIKYKCAFHAQETGAILIVPNFT